jgi:hypothetical protein
MQIDRAIVLPIGCIHAFVGIVSTTHHGDVPILEDLDNLGNTIHSDSDCESDSTVESRYAHQGDSIEPILDYESEDGSVEPFLEEQATTGAVLMVALSTAQDPLNPNAGQAGNDNVNANANAGGGAPPRDVLQTPIATNIIVELTTADATRGSDQEDWGEEDEAIYVTILRTLGFTQVQPP